VPPESKDPLYPRRSLGLDITGSRGDGVKCFWLFPQESSAQLPLSSCLISFPCRRGELGLYECHTHWNRLLLVPMPPQWC